MALAWVLISEGLHNEDFVQRYTVGYARFRDYLLGHVDGQPKDPQWAAALTDIPAQQIVDLARRMASKRTMINVAYSLQRSIHGEQPFWMTVTLAALLGQIGFARWRLWPGLWLHEQHRQRPQGVLRAALFPRQ
ncbi:S/N-oxide reductase [Pseudomonas savastanoi pv. phaseolicola]|nr:S/N-oxide reductase [Pseudomonas savastanoi pv. phaseolicola]